MKTLSVRQPWASLIANGRKTIELRSWSTKYRGPIRIISGVSKWTGKTPYPDGPRGVTLCEAELADVRPATPEDTDAAGLPPPDGWFAWVLRDARPIAQIPIKGRLGLYDT